MRLRANFLPSVQFSLRLLPFAALIVVACVAIPLLTGVQAQQAAATYTHGNLAVTIPYHGASKGSGRLVAELLDPEGNVLGRVERAAEVGKNDGAWQVTIVPEKAIPFDEIIWQRLRYRFVYNDAKDAIGNAAIEGIEPISFIFYLHSNRVVLEQEAHHDLAAASPPGSIFDDVAHQFVYRQLHAKACLRRHVPLFKDSLHLRAQLCQRRLSSGHGE